MPYSRQFLSASTDGRPVPVVAVASPGTNIHTAPAGTQIIDEPQITATNTSAAAVTLTVEWGGVGVGNWLVDTYTIPAFSAPVPITNGHLIRNGLSVAAFASVANVVNVAGGIIRVQ